MRECESIEFTTNRSDCQPNKTPKTTKLKLTTPKDPDAAQKPKASKAKKATAKTSEEPAEEAVEEPAEEVAEKPVKEKPEVTPEEARAIKQKRGMALTQHFQLIHPLTAIF